MHTAHAEYVSALLAAGKSAAEVDTEMADIAGARCMAYLTVDCYVFPQPNVTCRSHRFHQINLLARS